MDKYEYKVRSEEISNLIDKEKYTEAVDIADTIDWRRVKSATMLLKIAALYRVNRRNEDSREILLLAYERYPTNRSVVYSLCELSIELDDVVAAIEYYKQFVKLAPKDNGVYTLRYRILEAQEASLEERIEILEELKKRDYQEEWAYELAYLYHRVGLATKCVEECDDIILWFGDGPYVMKAMELKALHVPLTEVQQAKYDTMLNHSQENYNTEENYSDSEYTAESYDGQGYENGEYAAENYDEQGYENGEYAAESYGGQGYENGEYAAESYGGQGYENGEYAAESYNGQGYENGEYAAESYDGQGYENGEYAAESYDGQGYENGEYAAENYDEQGYENGEYAPDGYVDDGYGNISYVGGTYQDNGYTGEFYVEQTFDENGNPIEAGNYSEENDNLSVAANASDDGYDSNGYGQESYADNDYTADTYGNDIRNDAAYSAQGYNQGAYTQENHTAANNAGDMSQYNTINLQKVVAESMKELFPDDDVFAEDREKYNSGEMESITGNTLVYANAPSNHTMEAADEISDLSENDSVENAVDADTEEPAVEENVLADNEFLSNGQTKMEEPDVLQQASEPKEPNILKQAAKTEESQKTDLPEKVVTAPEADIAEKSFVQTDRIARMTTGVSEAAPEPHTGAIKKVIIPGDNARFIKTDSDIDELRDTTEQTVNEEHNRMEYNDENVYHEQSLKEASVETVQKQATGSMNLDDVLEEWERMKLNNAKKHQEEIKQHVLTQTGKIFENFDNSIKSGILGELEREEAQAQRNASSKDGFLEADITEDIPQHELKQVSDDDFDVAYLPEETSQEGGSEAKPEELSHLERVVAQELGGLTHNIPQTELNRAMDQKNQAGLEKDSQAAEDYDDGDISDEQTYDDMQEISDAQDTAYYDEEYDTEQTYDDTDYAGESYGEGTYEEDTFDKGDVYDEDAYGEEDSGLLEEDTLDPEEEESIAEMAMEDALKTQEIKMNTADLSSLSEKIVATTKKEAKGAKREEIRDFTSEEQELFENFAVTKKIKKQIVYALDNMTLAAYTGNVIITGDAGLDTVRMAKNLVKEYHAADANFSGKVAKITGEKINQRNLKDIFEKLDNGGIIIEKANGMSEEKLYEMASLLNQETFGIIVIMEDTKKEITKLLEKQAMIADYFNLRIDLMEMDNNALVAYAKNYALALEYSIDELGTLALYTRIANMQSGNHVVTKDEVRDIVDEAIWKSKKSKIKNFVDVLFARRYDSEDMIVLKERDFI